MSTTEVFVELLAAGALALIAILLLVMAPWAETNWWAAVPSNLQIAVGIVAITVAYPLGIVIDSLADHALRFVDDDMKEKHKIDKESVAQLSREEKLTDFFGRYFQYNRVRTRMLRSFMLNCCFLVAVGTIVYVMRREVPLALYGAWTAAWFLLGASAFWAYRKVRDSWYEMLKECCDSGTQSAGREAGEVVPSTGRSAGNKTHA